MELIIEIPEEVYKTVQDGSYCGSLYEELKAAIPYNPSGDLISRGVAINLLNEAQVEYDEYYKGLGKAKTIIDNVPTVEVRNNKPKQGEWIKEPNGKTTDIYRCSVCKRSIMLCKGADLTNYPFCHCGADMRNTAKPTKKVEKLVKVGECKCNTCKYNGTSACYSCNSCFDKYEAVKNEHRADT